MPKAKLVINAKDMKKAESAAHFSGVKIDDSYTVAGETTLEVSCRDAANLYQMGIKLNLMDGTELDALKKRQEAKAREAAKVK